MGNVTNILIVEGVSEVRTSQRDPSRNYVVATLAEAPKEVMVAGKKYFMKSNKKSVSRVFWETGANGSKGDRLYPDLVAGQCPILEGSIETIETEPYDITDADGTIRSVSTWTGAVLASETYQQVLGSDRKVKGSVEEEFSEEIPENVFQQ